MKGIPDQRQMDIKSDLVRALTAELPRNRILSIFKATDDRYELCIEPRTVPDFYVDKKGWHRAEPNAISDEWLQRLALEVPGYAE